MNRKPSRQQILLGLLAIIGIIHVGDSLHSDVAGAHKVGIRAAWVSRADRIGDIGTEKPDFTWPDLRPLPHLT